MDVKFKIFQKIQTDVIACIGEERNADRLTTTFA